jgi:hypothetical protein
MKPLPYLTAGASVSHYRGMYFPNRKRKTERILFLILAPRGRTSFVPRHSFLVRNRESG